MPVRITIGNRELIFHAYSTTAPKNFDGFETIEMKVVKERRFVLIPEQRLDWQIARYASGLHRAALATGVTDRFVERFFSERLLFGQPAEGF